jgi:putative ubiquitin-RnfH superfamily antitoxin RatB of RatAB toxin-antitoxin module
VSVVLAEPGRASCVNLALAPGATLIDAAQASGLWQPASGLTLGVWGHRLPGDTVLADGDRVEIYRPLQIDPKDARRHRAELRRALKPKG